MKTMLRLSTMELGWRDAKTSLVAFCIWLSSQWVSRISKVNTRKIQFDLRHFLSLFASSLFID